MWMPEIRTPVIRRGQGMHYPLSNLPDHLHCVLHMFVWVSSSCVSGHRVERQLVLSGFMAQGKGRTRWTLQASPCHCHTQSLGQSKPYIHACLPWVGWGCIILLCGEVEESFPYFLWNTWNYGDYSTRVIYYASGLSSYNNMFQVHVTPIDPAPLLNQQATFI